MSEENKLVLDRDVAKALAYMSKGGTYEGYEVIENEYVDSTRWSGIYKLVIKKIGELGFWATDYEKGLTEYQSDEPFDYDEPVFYRVRPEHVQTIKWVVL